jgi:putative ribosome biogenesis GTPase RsgA
VGKSTLLNHLLGHAQQAVRDVRRGDDRGRHATTTRQLFPLPGGALLLDTPGVRALEPWAGEAALDTVLRMSTRWQWTAVSAIAGMAMSRAAPSRRR